MAFYASKLIWMENAIGGSSAWVNAIINVNAVYRQICSKRVVYEGSPNITTAVEIMKNKKTQYIGLYISSTYDICN